MRALVRLSRGLPEPAHDQLEASVDAYARRVLDHERDAMALGKENLGAERAFAAIWQSLLLFEPASARMAALHAESLARLSDASESRRLRLFQMGWSVPTAPWCVLLAIGIRTAKEVARPGRWPSDVMPTDGGLRPRSNRSGMM